MTPQHHKTEHNPEILATQDTARIQKKNTKIQNTEN